MQKLIQPHRRLIYEGVVMITREGNKPPLTHTIYLFNDILIIAKESEKESREG